MRILSAEFAASAVKDAGFPKDRLPEVALIGRSNVGKSSLINVFTGRKIAKTSSTPGKTRTVNFYRINNAFYLVDLPGLGYAKVSATEKKSWERMIGDYFKDRLDKGLLKGALIILDPRREAGETEASLYNWAAGLGIQAVTVFTKSDKLSRGKLSSGIAKIKRAVPAGASITFSSLTGEGRDALGKKIRELLKEG